MPGNKDKSLCSKYNIFTIKAVTNQLYRIWDQATSEQAKSDRGQEELSIAGERNFGRR